MFHSFFYKGICLFSYNNRLPHNYLPFVVCERGKIPIFACKMFYYESKQEFKVKSKVLIRQCVFLCRPNIHYGAFCLLCDG